MGFWEESRGTRLFYLLGSARLFTIFTGIAILLMLKRQRNLARLGSVHAARALLLPIYEPMIVMLVLSLSMEYLCLLWQYLVSRALLVTVLAQWSLDMFTQTGLVLFFCSRSLSQASMGRSLFHAFGCCIIGFVCAAINQLYSRYLGQMLFNAIPLLLMIIILRKGIYRRRSVVPAVQFMILYRTVWCVYVLFEFVDSRIGYLCSLTALVLLEIPLSLMWYVTMFNDTFFWRTGGLRFSSVFAVLRRLGQLLWRTWGDAHGKGVGAKPPSRSGATKIRQVAVVEYDEQQNSAAANSLAQMGGFAPLLSPQSGADMQGEGDGDLGGGWDGDADVPAQVAKSSSWWRRGFLRKGLGWIGVGRGGSGSAARRCDHAHEHSSGGSPSPEWGHDYEAEAMQRIRLLQERDRQFEAKQRALQQQAQREGRGGSMLVPYRSGHDASDAGGSLILLSTTPTSYNGSLGHAPMNTSMHPHGPGPGAPNTSPAPPSSFSAAASGSSASSRHNRPGQTLPQGQHILTSGSDHLLSHDVQLLIEENARRFIDFALLHINDNDCIGRGGSSKVYSGFYRNYPVAIKFFHVPGAGGGGGGGGDSECGSSGSKGVGGGVEGEELTPALIRAYAKETAIAAAFNHPSVVQFIGICVRPPAIFLVSELCSEGSLFGVLPMLRFHPAWSYQAILAFAVQTAQSVDYLHSGGFVHRDIKSLNYMVTRRGEVKLTDFGLSRMFPQWDTGGSASAQAPPGSAAPTPLPALSRSPSTHRATPPMAVPQQQQRQHGAGATPAAVASGGVLSRSPSALYGSVPPPQPMSPKRNAAMANNMLTRRVGSRVWMSPEMLHGQTYSFSSDIYSLTLVLWEILTCQAPFEEVDDELELKEMLLAGVTPEIPPWTPQPYAQLLREGWSREPARRPTAADMLARLEHMLREVNEQLPPLDTSVFFGPGAREAALDNQRILYEQQQQQMMEEVQRQEQMLMQQQYSQPHPHPPPPPQVYPADGSLDATPMLSEEQARMLHHVV